MRREQLIAGYIQVCPGRFEWRRRLLRLPDWRTAAARRGTTRSQRTGVISGVCLAALQSQPGEVLEYYVIVVILVVVNLPAT